MARLLALLLPLFVAVVPVAASDAKPAASGALHCYGVDDPVSCFLTGARHRLQKVRDPGDRAAAAAEVLYALAATGRSDDALLRQAMTLARRPGIAPHREMALLYAIDLYEFGLDSPMADVSYDAATHRFAELEKAAGGQELLDLYIGACAILGWEDDFLDRWADFVQQSCDPDKLARLQVKQSDGQAWLLAVMPSAMTAAGDWDRYRQSAEIALSWLDQAGTSAARQKNRAARDLMDELGVVMYSLNSVSLRLFEQNDAADGAIERSLKYLRRLEKRAGISGTTTPLRRTVAELLFRNGREKEARKMIRDMLARVDADPAGKRIPLGEQATILALAANLEDLGATCQDCPPPPDTRDT